MELAELEMDNTDELNDPSAMAHRSLRRDPFWKSIPAYEQVDEETFHSHLFQTRNAITSVEKLKDALGDLADSDFYEDLRQGLHHAPMSIRILLIMIIYIMLEN